MKQQLARLSLSKIICAWMVACSLLFCGLTAYASDLQQPTPVITSYSEDMLYPADVQYIDNDTDRQIVKTYSLSTEEDPAAIPRNNFEHDGWLYELTDITQSRTGGTDTRPHTETVEITTDSNDLNEIIGQLSQSLEYESGDGYCGVLTLDLASVTCEAAGIQNSSYTVTVMREYPDLPTNDLYFIPKTISDNGTMLALDNVVWEAQNVVKAGYTDIPDSYRAIAKYTGKALQNVATGYVTTADYTGEITRSTIENTVYTACFVGTPVIPTSNEPEATAKSIGNTEGGSIPVVPLIVGAVIIMLLGGAAAFYFLRHNVKVSSIKEDGYGVLVAKVRISAKNLIIDLTPLDGRSENHCFSLEIDKLAAQSLNGKTVEVIFGSIRLQHKIAYEGNVYKIQVDFDDMTIKAIY